jgi:hypothetical protein
MRLIELRHLGIVLVTALVTSCGGGGGSSTAAGGIGGTGINSVGVVTGFGSVFVNGVEYDTSNANGKVTVNGKSGGSQNDLRIGMVVAVHGTIDSNGKRFADSITYSADVRGPVSGACVPGATITVLGQPVVIDNQTREDGGFRCDASSVGQIVEVSGLVDASGVLRATRVELRSGSGDPLEAKGVVKNFDASAKTFSINGLSVDFSGIAAVNGLANDARVEVTGVLGTDGVLKASKIVVEESGGASGGGSSGGGGGGVSVGGSPGQQAEVEGFITSFTSATEFQVNGNKVSTTAATVFAGGAAGELAANRKVSVTGTLDSSGTVVASKVTFESETRPVDIEGNVTSLDLAGGSLSLFQGTGPGITVKSNASTTFKDSTKTPDPSFSLDKIAVGDHLKISATDDGSGVAAAQVERNDTSDKVSLRGLVNAKSAPNDFTIKGATVHTDAATTKFLRLDEAEFAAPAQQNFFAALVENATAAKVEGTFDGSRIVAETLQIEDR